MQGTPQQPHPCSSSGGIWKGEQVQRRTRLCCALVEPVVTWSIPLSETPWGLKHILGKKKQNFRSHSLPLLLTYGLAHIIIFRNWLELLTVGWLFLDRTDYPAAFAKPWVANCIAHVTITGSSNLSAAIAMKVQSCQEKSAVKVQCHKLIVKAKLQDNMQIEWIIHR